jgi:murein L,D-transpeptidase YafK
MEHFQNLNSRSMIKYAATFLSLLGMFSCFSCSLGVTDKKAQVPDTSGSAKTIEDRLHEILKTSGLEEMPDSIAILGFKEERLLELWAWHQNRWLLLKQYPFTAFSGTLGPKLQRGDRQIPEGIYRIELLNPQSTYHRSLRVSYPSEFDRNHARVDGRSNLGGDIYIHGYNATIGCIPIGDEAIEEVYAFGEIAFKKGIRVILAPRDFRKNPDFPNIEGITWENELYISIKQELMDFPE